MDVKPQRRWDLLPSCFNGSFLEQVFIFIDLNKVKGCITQKCTGIYQRILFKEILKKGSMFLRQRGIYSRQGNWPSFQ